MRLVSALALALLTDLARPAMAGEAAVPEFFRDGQRYVARADQCAEPAGSDREDLRSITVLGISAYEYGCGFLAFLPSKDALSGEIHGWVAQASCGDDSGIERPDSFYLALQPDGKRLQVQSQSEYATGEALLLLELRHPELSAMSSGEGQDPYEAASFISGDYVACEGAQ